MKKSRTNLLIGLVPSLLLTNNVGARRINDIVSTPSRHQRETLSNDVLGKPSNIYDCDGMSIDWSGPSTTGVVVQYDYDLFINKGSDIDTALAQLQHKLLQHVGTEIFSDCARRLAISGSLNLSTERQLDESVIQEISSAPEDTESSSPCKIEDTADETECHPISGFITVHTTPGAEDIRRLEESSAYETITNSVKTAMEDGTLVTDTTKGVYYLGDRDTFTFDSSYLEGGSNAHEDESTSWWSNYGGIVIGAIAGLVAIAVVAVLYKKRMSSKKDNDKESASVESADEELEEREAPPEKVTDEEEAKPNEGLDNGLGYSEAHTTSPAGCNFFEVLGNDE